MTARWHRLVTAAAAALVIGGCSDDPPSANPSPAQSTPTDAPRATSTSAATPTSGPAPTDTGGASSSPTTAVAPSTPNATQPPTPGPEPRVELRVVAEIDNPVDLALRPGDPTMYIVQQDGFVRVVRDGVLDETPVLDIRDRVRSGGEQGLLGLAFHPSAPLAYVNYTDRDGDTVVAEIPVEADGSLDADGERTVLSIDQPYANHNGGRLVFGPDGMLYIGMGDGGSQGDPERRALDVGELLGKLLRIDPVASGGEPYSVPGDNPFVGQRGARGEIWSIGLRNPWRFGFDQLTGDLWIADVGGSSWEEIDVAWADDGAGKGRSFGWSAYEADQRLNRDQPGEGHVGPIHAYDHDQGCSISGGARYRGGAIPALAGWYVYSDYCGGSLVAIEILDRGVGREVELASGLDSVSGVVEGPGGELYVLSLSGTVSLVTPG